MTFGSLFAGIGGFDLGLERAGLVCSWQVEIDEFCRRVLAKHWPNVRRWDDVRTFPQSGDWGVDVIAGGLPCQDISSAGKRRGIEGERSGLWKEMLRIVRVLRPRFVVVENVAALRFRGLDTVLAGLAASGYDAEWDCIPAAAFGAPHRRDRVFILAYRDDEHRVFEKIHARAESSALEAEPQRRLSDWPGEWVLSRSSSGRIRAVPWGGRFRGFHGLPGELDRIRGLANAVCPQVAEWIGRRLIGAAG